MKKIIISIATTFIASAALVACNSGTTNASDVNSPGATTPLAKAACTSSNNWQSVGIGMDATQVQARLGAPIRIVSVPPNTEYHYERCRGFLKLAADATDDTVSNSGVVTPGKPAQYTITDVEGVVVISGARGVISTASPIRIEDLVVCELDYFNRPYDSIYTVNAKGYVTSANCRAANNQY